MFVQLTYVQIFTLFVFLFQNFGHTVSEDGDGIQVVRGTLFLTNELIRIASQLGLWVNPILTNVLVIFDVITSCLMLDDVRIMAPVTVGTRLNTNPQKRSDKSNCNIKVYNLSKSISKYCSGGNFYGQKFFREFLVQNFIAAAFIKWPLSFFIIAYLTSFNRLFDQRVQFGPFHRFE